MKKEEIYVVINSEKKRLRAIQILTDEKVMTYSSLLHEGGRGQLTFDIDAWNLPSFKYNLGNKTQITLDQLEQLLSPKQEPMKLDALKLIAESYGFELVEKKFYKNIKRFIIWKSHKKNKRSLDVNFLIL